MNNTNKAVFIDLQGTLGGEPLGDIMDFEFYPFAIEAVKLLNENNILAIVVTNQSHIAKGILTYEDFENKLEEIKLIIKDQGAHVDAVYCCPHGKEDKCACKKPLTGMLMQAKKDFNINIEESHVIGDMGMADMIMAKSAGAKGILVLTGVGEGSLTTFRHTWAEIEADYVADNVLKAVKWILSVA